MGLSPANLTTITQDRPAVPTFAEAAQPILGPTDEPRERYWFTRNLSRVDCHALRRMLQRRVRPRGRLPLNNLESMPSTTMQLWQDCDCYCASMTGRP
jgi:hypothetical protein